MDLYVTFSSTIARRSVRDVSFDIGPLFTKMCTNTTRYDDRNMTRVSCLSLLFYQIPIDDYAPSSAMLMVAMWIPIIAGVLLTRLTFWKIHSTLQFIVSCGYLGAIYILFRDGYSPGMSTAIIAGRVAYTSIGIFIVVAFIIIKICREKYCTDTPTIIGVSYVAETPGHDSDDSDMLSAEYWDRQKTYITVEE